MNKKFFKLLEFLKRKIINFRYKKSFIIFFLIFLLIIFSNDNKFSKPHIAKIKIEDIITQDLFRYEKLRELSKNNNTKAVIFFINSPGGTVVGGETLYKSIKNISKTKPVISVMGELATSAAYMASLGSEYIFAQEGTITGSVGVLILTSEFTELAKKIGVSTEIIKSGDLKASPSPLEKMTPETREATQKIVKEMSKNFINLVKNERNLNRKTTELISDGRIFTGKSAQDLGLIDDIGNLDEAKNYLNDRYKIFDLPVHEFKIIKELSFLEKFSSNLTSSLNLTRLLKLKGLISIWIEN